MLSMANFGSFYIGGEALTVSGKPKRQVARNDHVVIEVNPNGEYSNGAMYVQFYKPTVQTGSYLLIHGGGLSGAFWEYATAYQKSWIQHLLAIGKAVYVIDAVGSGRSGYCPHDPRLAGREPDLRTNERTWTHFRFGTIESGEWRLFPGSKSDRETYESISKQNIPRWNDNIEPSVRAIKELLNRETDWHIFAHSQGADIAMRILSDARVKDVLLIEPAAFPVLDDSHSVREKVVNFLYGDNIDQSPFWTDMLSRAEDYMRGLTAKGVTVKELRLPAIGITGNTHMLVHDQNSQQVFVESMRLMTGHAPPSEEMIRPSANIASRSENKSVRRATGWGFSLASIFCCRLRRKNSNSSQAANIEKNN